MKEEQIKILKTMNEATNRMDIHMFAQAVNLEPNQTIEQVQKLAAEGFLRKVGGGYIFIHRLLMEYFASLGPE